MGVDAIWNDGDPAKSRSVPACQQDEPLDLLLLPLGRSSGSSKVSAPSYGGARPCSPRPSLDAETVVSSRASPRLKEVAEKAVNVGYTRRRQLRDCNSHQRSLRVQGTAGQATNTAATRHRFRRWPEFESPHPTAAVGLQPLPSKQLVTHVRRASSYGWSDVNGAGRSAVVSLADPPVV
jgi:hypothetical protein